MRKIILFLALAAFGCQKEEPEPEPKPEPTTQAQATFRVRCESTTQLFIDWTLNHVGQSADTLLYTDTSKDTSLTVTIHQKEIAVYSSSSKDRTITITTPYKTYSWVDTTVQSGIKQYYLW